MVVKKEAVVHTPSTAKEVSLGLVAVLSLTLMILSVISFAIHSARYSDNIEELKDRFEYLRDKNEELKDRAERLERLANALSLIQENTSARLKILEEIARDLRAEIEEGR